LVFIHAEIDGIEIHTEGINMIKLELNQEVVLTAEAVDRRGNPVGIDEGSAVWSVTAMDVDGNEVPDALTIEPSGDNEMSAVLSSTDQEVTGLVTLRADGDPDENEEVEIIATLDVIVDAGNAVALTLTAAEPTDTEPEPEPTPEPEPAPEA
jgi:hypothetical protein